MDPTPQSRLLECFFPSKPSYQTFQTKHTKYHSFPQGGQINELVNKLIN